MRDWDRSELHSDEGPPIGEVAAEPWAENGFRDHGQSVRIEQPSGLEKNSEPLTRLREEKTR